MLLTGPADNIPGGRPQGGERSYQVRPILEYTNRGRRFVRKTPSRGVRLLLSRASVQPSSLPRAVAHAGDPNSTPALLSTGRDRAALATPNWRRGSRPVFKRCRPCASGRRPSRTSPFGVGGGSCIQRHPWARRRRFPTSASVLVGSLRPTADASHRSRRGAARCAPVCVRWRSELSRFARRQEPASRAKGDTLRRRREVRAVRDAGAPVPGVS